MKPLQGPRSDFYGSFCSKGEKKPSQYLVSCPRWRSLVSQVQILQKMWSNQWNPRVAFIGIVWKWEQVLQSYHSKWSCEIHYSHQQYHGFNTFIVPKIQACDPRSLFFAWTGWGLGTRLASIYRPRLFYWQSRWLPCVQHVVTMPAHLPYPTLFARTNLNCSSKCIAPDVLVMPKLHDEYISG